MLEINIRTDEIDVVAALFALIRNAPMNADAAAIREVTGSIDSSVDRLRAARGAAQP